MKKSSALLLLASTLAVALAVVRRHGHAAALTRQLVAEKARDLSGRWLREGVPPVGALDAVDAWGRPLQVTFGGGVPVLQSAGPDGVFGTADDLLVPLEAPGGAPR